MIQLDRSRVPTPRFFDWREADELRAQVARFMTRPLDERPQSDVFAKVTPTLTRFSVDALLALTHGKCAYCESPIAASGNYDLEHFRPKRLGGERDPKARDHYWWLAIEWSNLLVACTKCNAAKRNFFPIAGTRCAVGAGDVELAAELPLLLDPCRIAPERVLVFEADGTVRPRFRPGDRVPPIFGLGGGDSAAAIAATTIELLQLNRSQLVRERRKAAIATSDLMSSLLKRAGLAPGSAPWRRRLQFAASKVADELRDVLVGRRPYAAAVRFEVARFAAEHALLIHDLPALVPVATRLASYGEALVDEAEAAPRRGGHRGASKRKDTPAGQKPVGTAQPTLFAEAAITQDRVTRVKLRSFRAIESLVFTLPKAKPDDLVPHALRDLDGFAEIARNERSSGWKMLLGENGAGKSSILQAIAIALMGEAFARSPDGPNLSHSLRHGSRDGEIVVEFEESKPVHIAITPNGLLWRTRPEGVPVFVRGYGATRLLPRRSTSNANVDTNVGARVGASQVLTPRRVDSLFDPHAPLVDAEAWLRALDEHDWHEAMLNLKRLMDVDENVADFAFEGPGPRDGRFGLRWRATGVHGTADNRRRKHAGQFEPLDHFSAGYQSLLALACDLMAGSGVTIGSMKELPGIVLLDEIGTNLHPRWRLDIVRRLGNTFPRLQFVASTHEPLCLRGLGHGEVAVVQRAGDHIALRDDLPSPAALRVDQLLTSDFFGLASADDPVTVHAFDVYYDLLARGDDLNAAERVVRDRLREQLATSSLLGTTQRDRMLLRAVDEELARRRRESSTKGSRRNRTPISPAVADAVRRALGDGSGGGTGRTTRRRRSGP